MTQCCTARRLLQTFPLCVSRSIQEARWINKKNSLRAIRAVVVKWWQKWFTGGNVGSASNDGLSLPRLCNSVTFNRMSRKTLTSTSGNKAVAVENSFEPANMLLCCRCAGIYSPYCTRFVWYESFLSLQWSLVSSRCFFSVGRRGLQACFSFIENILISLYTWHFKDFSPWEMCRTLCIRLPFTFKIRLGILGQSRRLTAWLQRQLL